MITKTTKNNEEFTDKEAEFYNNEIDNFEKGNLDNVTELTLEDLEKRILKLEMKININNLK